MPRPERLKRVRHPARPRGVALVVVAVLLLLCGIAVAGVSRILLLHGSRVGGDVDAQRAFAAAEALLRDAETDVLMQRPGGSAIAFPFEAGDKPGLDAALAALAPDAALPCRDGICAPANLDILTDIVALLPRLTDPAHLTPTFATYGQFTRAGAPPFGAEGNPYLARDAWYWVEVFDYPVAAGIANAGSSYQPGPDRPYVFRITAVVLGQRPGTRAVLREVFVPSPLVEPP